MNTSAINEWPVELRSSDPCSTQLSERVYHSAIEQLANFLVSYQNWLPISKVSSTWHSVVHSVIEHDEYVHFIQLSFINSPTHIHKYTHRESEQTIQVIGSGLKP